MTSTENREPARKTWLMILVAFLAGGGGSTLVLSLHEPRPDPHTGKDDTAARGRDEVRVNQQIEELRKQIRVLQADQKRHLEAEGLHCQKCE